MTPLVILCSRNGEKYLHAQILSILKQTEPGVRLLISDDVSTDSTARIARDYQELYPEQIRFVQRTEPSGGAARHFMSVLHSFGADADYTMLADQDDVWHPDKVSRTLAAMKKAEEKYGADTPLLVHCDMRVTDEAGNEIAPSYVRYQQMSPKRNQLNQLLVQNNVTGGAMMMNRALVRVLRRHPVPEHPVMHDHWIAPRPSERLFSWTRRFTTTGSTGTMSSERRRDPGCGRFWTVLGCSGRTERRRRRWTGTRRTSIRPCSGRRRSSAGSTGKSLPRSSLRCFGHLWG